MDINVEGLDQLVQKGQELSTILKNQDVLRFMELAAQMGSTFSEIIPKRTDSLVFPSEVRSILRISNSTLKQYCREGRLTPVLTPPRGKTKFWLSQVLAIPEKA